MTRTTPREQVSRGPALPLEAYGDSTRRVFVGLMWGLTAFIAVLVAIAAFAPIHRVAVAEGSVTPTGSVIAMGHPEGGIVADLPVKVGQTVRKGEVLLRLKPVAAESDLGQVEARGEGLDLARERLGALLEDRPARFPSEEGNARVSDERALYDSEREALRQVVDAADARIAQRRGEIASGEGEAQALRAQVAKQEELAKIRQDLLKEGYARRTEVIDAELQLSQTRARLAAIEGQVRIAVVALRQAESERAQAIADRRRQWAADLARISGEQAETSQSQQKFAARLQDLEVRAPEDGRIQDIVPKAAGAVVRAGEPVLELVPTNATLEAEVRILPQDIGEVAVGSRAKVALTAFDSEVYGEITGVVRSISPTTFRTEQGQPYYRATLALSRTQLKRKGQTYQVMPGMVVRAEIITGERSLLRHFMKPIDRALERAFQQGY
jgi:HlyD family secretion protein/adhesin transport system membrane fusion protein